MKISENEHLRNVAPVLRLAPWLYYRRFAERVFLINLLKMCPCHISIFVSGLCSCWSERKELLVLGLLANSFCEIVNYHLASGISALGFLVAEKE